MGVWFASRGDEFDPGERDISMEVLLAQSVEDKLYRTPFKRWIDPAVAFAGGPARPDLGIFPASLAGLGWEAASRVQDFDASNLYEKINGQADQYMQFGFEHLHYLALANPTQDLDLSIELYDMGTFPNALGIFAAQRSQGTRVEREGNAYYYLTEAGVLGITGAFFYKLTASDSGPVVRDKALQFIRDFSQEDEEANQAQVPAPMLLLTEGLGVAFQDVEYQLKDVFQFDFAEHFWFGRPGGESKTRYYLHEAENSEAAEELFEQLLAEQLFDYTLVERDGNDALLTHEYLKNFMTLNQSGNYVYGVENADDAAQARATMETLRATLPATPIGTEQ